MKVIHINEHLDLRGGVEVYFLSLIPALENLGHQQIVVYGIGMRELVKEAYQIQSLSSSDLASERQCHAKLTDILKKERPDVVHIHQTFNTGVILK